MGGKGRGVGKWGGKSSIYRACLRGLAIYIPGLIQNYHGLIVQYECARVVLVDPYA